MLGDVEKAWLAGFLDADGAIRLRIGQKNKRGKCLVPQVNFYNTCAYTISNLTRLMTKSYDDFRVSARLRGTEKDHWKPSYIVEIAGITRVRPFLMDVEPYLVTKKLEAKLILEFCHLRTQGYNLPYGEKEYRIHEALKYIKKTRHLRDYMPSVDEILNEDIVRTDAEALEAEETAARLSIEERKEWARNLVSKYRWHRS